MEKYTLTLEDKILLYILIGLTSASILNLVRYIIFLFTRN